MSIPDQKEGNNRASEIDFDATFSDAVSSRRYNNAGDVIETRSVQ